MAAPPLPSVPGAAPGSVKGSQLAMPLLMASVVALMILPLPTHLLDFLLTVNIGLSVLVLLVATQLEKPLDFSVFPSFLLVTTLFRLGLNLATTRLILLQGGTEGAGAVVETFGKFVVGGNIVVGVVVFIILTLINFAVITKGSGRIAEVSARFTLDALPGKQMSVDADLASGLLTQDQARAKRLEFAQEADFYGAMDGASKFVRGDAVAGLFITVVNIVGGLIIGMAMQDMEFAEAAETFTILTIGDGLVSQIPALLISTAAGMVVTRASDANDLGVQLIGQLLNNPVVLYATAVVLLALVLVPGMPVLPFLLLAGLAIYRARKLPPPPSRTAPGSASGTGSTPQGLDRRQGTPALPGPAGATGPGGRPLTEEEEITNLLPVHPLEFQVGWGLIPVVERDGNFIRRMTGLRKNMAKDLGIILPAVHVRDNLELEPGEYRLLIHGVEVARATVMPDRIMAMGQGEPRRRLVGLETKDPAFGLPALWINPNQRSEAELAGYSVIDIETLVITHLSEALSASASRLLGRDELQTLLEVVAKKSPRVVEELLPTVMSHTELLAVLRHLLDERVPVRDLRSILEALADAARYGKATPFLVDQVRQRLGAAIAQRFVEADGKLHVALFDGASEETLRQFIIRNEADAALAPDLLTAQALAAQLQSAHQRLQAAGHTPVIVTPPDIRYPLQRFITRLMPQMNVISQTELPPRLDVTTVMTMTLPARRGAPPPAPTARVPSGRT
jgi:flagellar biosynthesis protein FlhA